MPRPSCPWTCAVTGPVRVTTGAADGEIQCKGPMVFKEYYRNPEATADTIKAALLRYLGELQKLPADKLRAARNARIDGFGVYSEAAS